ncbi:MAG TPA: hypothetical protein VIM56_13095 [Rhizomicrobium sp.]
MTLVKPFAITSSAAVTAVLRKPARVEKISLSSELDGERHSAPQQDDFASAKAARVSLFHNRTAEPVVERDELRLVPAFVTQILAQMAGRMEADTALALLAYRNSASEIVPAYDADA